MTNAISTLQTIANNSFIKNVVARIESEEQGHGLVETAIVLVFILMTTFAIIDISRCVYTNSVVSAAAQEGARAGIVDTNAIRSTVANKMIGLDMNSTNINVTVDGDIVEVEIAYDFEFVTPLAHTFVNTMALTGSASMVTM